MQRRNLFVWQISIFGYDLLRIAKDISKFQKPLLFIDIIQCPRQQLIDEKVHLKISTPKSFCMATSYLNSRSVGT